MGETIVSSVSVEIDHSKPSKRVRQADPPQPRDWQAAIGDLMLEPQLAGGARRYDVRNYRSFTAIAIDGSDADKAWLARLGEFTEHLDVSVDEQYDARVGQLRGVYQAVAQLIGDFHDAAPEHSSVTDRRHIRPTLGFFRSTAVHPLPRGRRGSGWTGWFSAVRDGQAGSANQGA